MHFGVYTLLYTAEDSCGNETIEERTVEVISYSTVLFTDGTFIINEKSTDRNANIALHGAVTNEYYPLDPNGTIPDTNYIFPTNADRPWDDEARSITNVSIGSPIQPTSTAYWFYGCGELLTIDVVNLDMSNVTNARGMFMRCTKLQTVDVSSWDMSNVTDISYMFELCKAIQVLDVSRWNTSNVTTMHHMFGAGDDTQTFGNLYEFDVSNWDTSNVTDMSGAFWGCNRIRVLDVSNWDTSNVTDMSHMFERCQGLAELDLSNWDTSKVVNTSRMFAGTYYNNMFRLKTIYASNKFITAQVTNSSGMFANCDVLVGGAGTAYASSNPQDKTYAHIDGGTSNPGYFTAKA